MGLILKSNNQEIELTVKGYECPQPNRYYSANNWLVLSCQSKIGDQTICGGVPGVMNIMEVIRTAEALQGLASDLLSAIGTACEKCDECGIELLCDLMKGKICPEVCIPPQVMEEAGVDPETKLDCEVDPESGAIYIIEAGHRYDLSDIPQHLLDTFRECGICLSDLEDKLKEEEVVYGDELKKRFSD